MPLIDSFKDLHSGKNVFILASGPSLGECDLSQLKNKLVIGLNRSFLIYPETRYHCAMDHRLFDEYPKEFAAARCVFTLEGRPVGVPMKLLGAEGFSYDLAEGVYSGYTISYVALQLAVYMGFKRVFFLGLDLQNAGQQTHFFGHDHRSVTHDTTEYPKMRRMLEYGARTLGQSVVKVYNLSPVSTLPGFEPMSFEQALRL